MVPNFWSELVNPTDLYTSSVVLFSVAFFFGLTPFRLEGPRGARRLRVIALGLINTIGHVLVFTYFSVYCFINDESILRYFFQNDVSKFSEFLIRLVGLIGMPCLFIMCYARRNAIMSLIHKIALVDERLSCYGFDFHYRRFQVSSSLWIFLALGLNFAVIGYSWWMFKSYNFEPSIYAFAAFFQPNLFFSVILVMFYGFCVRFTRRLGIVNKVRNFKFSLIYGS